MAELPNQDPNISICLDDGTEGREAAGLASSDMLSSISDPDILGSMEAMASLVHSPTTDTLDSVALEPSPSDDESRLTEVEEGETEEGNTSPNTAQSLDTSLNPASAGRTTESDDINMFIGEPADSTELTQSQEDVPKQQLGNNDIEQQESEGFGAVDADQATAGPNLSSYFGDSSSGDFFDNLTEAQPVQESFPTATHSPRQRHSSQPEPEPVSFECEEPSLTGITAVPVEEEEALLDKESDAFESFTAEGSDVPLAENLSISPVHTNLGTPRHFFAEPGSGWHDGSQPDHSDLLMTDETISTTKDIENKLTLSCKKAAGISLTPEQLSPLPSPTHMKFDVKNTTAPLYPISQPLSESISPTSSSPAHQPQTLLNAAAAFQPFVENFLAGTEDPFTASLHMSDSDRRYDAWIPSDHTRQVIVSTVTSAPGTYYPSPEELCMPGLVLDDPQGDPVKEMLEKFSGEAEAAERQTLSVDQVAQDIQGVRKLIEGDCLRAAVDLVGRLITTAGQGVGRIGQITQHSPHLLQLWFLRLSLLTKLRLYSLAESESQAFKNLDTGDLYYEYYPQQYPGRKGSMVPFGLRILDAELPHYQGRTQDALDRLYYVLAVTQKILSNLQSSLAEDGSMIELSSESRTASLELWKEREIKTLCSIGNCLLSIKDFEAALQVYDGVLKKDEPHAADLLCAIGRIYLQMGDIEKSSSYFKQFEDATNNKDDQMLSRIAINKGLVLLAKNKFDEAHQQFKVAMKGDPQNPIAMNNLAVCLLYMGRLKDSLSTLEAMIKADPTKNLHEGVLFNLCTLYELESSRAPQKKQSLLELVSQYKGDSFPVASLKLL